MSGVLVEKPPVPLQSQLIKVWAFVQNADGTFSPAPSSSGGGGGNVNITGINGSAPALTNPLPVELSDGTNAFGTSGNPLSVSLHAETTKVIGTVNQGTSPWVVSGTVAVSNFPTTQPVSGTVAVTQSTSPWVVSNGGTFAVQAACTQTTSPWVVSGSVTANIGTTNGLALDATLTGGTMKTLVYDGTNNIFTSAHPGYVQFASAQAVTLASTTITGSVAVTNAGTFAVQDQSGGSTGATAPTKAEETGLIAATALPTAVTNGQLVGAMGDTFGRSAVVLNTTRNLVGTATLSSSSSTTVSFIAAGGANIFNDIITLIITNESSTATVVTLTDNGAGGNSYKFAIAANGGIVINFPTPLPQGTSNAAWQVLNSAAVALDYIAVFAKNK